MDTSISIQRITQIHSCEDKGDHLPTSINNKKSNETFNAEKSVFVKKSY